MKVAVCICVYNETTLLKASLRQFPNWIDKITVLVSDKPWFGDRSDDEYKTWEILQSWKDPRLEFFRMYWKTEHDQRNWGLGRLSEYDWVLIFDADEYLTREGWQQFYQNLFEYNGTPLLVASMRTYWKTPDWRWEPSDQHKPTVAVRPKQVSFFDKRQATNSIFRIITPEIYHFSWVRTDREVWQKIQNYMHAPDFDLNKWYVENWKGWTPEKAEEMTHLRPYGDPSKAIFDPAPKDIVDLFQG